MSDFDDLFTSLNQQFGQGGKPLPPPSRAMPPIPQGGSLIDVLRSSVDTMNMHKNQNDKANDPTNWKTEVKDGRVVDTLTLPREVTQRFLEASRWQSEALAAYAQEVNRLETQQRNMNPLLNVLATVGGNLAIADKRNPPLVQALGQSARQLNPTFQELEDRKLAVASHGSQIAEEGARSAQAQLQMQREGEYLRLAEQKEAAAEQEKSQKDADTRVNKLLLRASNVTKGGEPMSEDGFKALARTVLTKDDLKNNPQLVDDAYQQHIAGARAIKAGLDEKEGRDKELIAARGAQQRENQLRSFELKEQWGQKKEDIDKDMAKYRANLKADETLKNVTPKNLDKLAALKTTEEYLDRVTAILSKPEYQAMEGFKSAALKNVPKYLKSADRIELENLLAHETPRTLQLILGSTSGGGASILRTEQGRQMLAQLGISADNTPDQAMKIMGNLRGTVHDLRKGVVTETPEPDTWTKRRLLLGKDADDLIGFIQSGKEDPMGLR